MPKTSKKTQQSPVPNFYENMVAKLTAFRASTPPFVGLDHSKLTYDPLAKNYSQNANYS